MHFGFHVAVARRDNALCRANKQMPREFFKLARMALRSAKRFLLVGAFKAAGALQIEFVIFTLIDGLLAWKNVALIMVGTDVDNEGSDAIACDNIIGSLAMDGDEQQGVAYEKRLAELYQAIRNTIGGDHFETVDYLFGAFFVRFSESLQSSLASHSAVSRLQGARVH